jgi:hypothetical protein
MAARLSALRADGTLLPGFFIFKDSWYSHLLEAEYPMGTGGCFFGGKAAEALIWPLTSNCADVKKIWIYTATPPYAFMA